MGDVIVVGAGITGSFTAFFLAQKGIPTVLIKQAGMAHHASVHNPGGLNPLHGPGIPGLMSLFAMHSFELHLSHQQQIRDLSGVNFEFRRVSRIELAFDDEDREQLLATAKLYDRNAGFSAQWLNRDEVLELEPRINPAISGGLLMAGNGMVDSHQYLLAISRAAEKLGARILEGAATGLGHDGSRLTEVVLDMATLACEAVVIATGPWVAGPERWLSVNMPVIPLKGELLFVEASGPVYKHHISRQGSGMYVLPSGKIYLGGTQENAGFDTTPTSGGRNGILHDNENLVPGIQEAQIIEHAAALRPMTNDGYPVLGKVPGWDNAYIATGAGTKGMLIGAGMGEAVACLIAGKQPPVSIEAFALERFVDPERTVWRGNDLR